MLDRKVEKLADTKSRRLRQAVDRQAEKDILSSQHDSLAQVISGTGNAASARAHASALNRATAGRPARAGHSMLRLQRQYGNRYVQRVLALARKGNGRAEVAPEVERAIQRVRGGGQSLDSGVRAQMEPAFGADFSTVRVHTDAEADTVSRSLNARAFTTGQDVFFRQGAYNPSSSSGRELLTHELTHVVQQAGGARPKLTLGQPGDRYEQEADRVARAVIRQEQQIRQRQAAGGFVHRQPEEEEEEKPVQTKMEDAWTQRQAEEEKEELIQAKEEAPEEEETEPECTQYTKSDKPGFKTSIGSVTLNADLKAKLEALCQSLIEGCMVNGNITFNTGVRTSKTAHKWHTAWMIEKGNVPLQNLKDLEGGKDEDDIVWWKTEWNDLPDAEAMEEAKAYASPKGVGNYAAEGYDTGDSHRLPCNCTKGKSNHLTGDAIDATIPWTVGKWSTEANNRVDNARLKRPVPSEAHHFELK